jgi:antitoxin VapB
MSLNIKDQEAHELVRELAALRGTSLTSAVKLAVRNEIERERANQGGVKKPKKRSEVLQAFARQFVSRVKDRDDIHSWDIDKLLYDENGLPK